MILAPFGVVFIVLLTWLLGGSRKAPALDQTSAQNRFSMDFPECTPVSCTLAQDASGALLETQDGRIGVITPLGDCHTTRLWKRGVIEHVALNDGTLTVTTRDYKMPEIRLTLADQSLAKGWQASLMGLRGAAA